MNKYLLLVSLALFNAMFAMDRGSDAEQYAIDRFREVDNYLIWALKDNVPLNSFKATLEEKKPSIELLNEALLYYVGNPSTAIKKGFASWLIEYGADVNARTLDGSTTLMLFVSSKHEYRKEDIEFIEFLIVSGAQVNSQRDDGATALLLAVNNAKAINYEKVVRALLLAGADAEIEDAYGRSPLIVGEQTGLEPLMKKHTSFLKCYKKIDDTLALVNCCGCCSSCLYMLLTAYWFDEAGYKNY